MRVEDNGIGWSSSVRNVGKDMERIVRDLMRIRAFAVKDFKGFSKKWPYSLWISGWTCGM